MSSKVLMILALFQAAAALELDSKSAPAEAAKLCMNGDFGGATALLESLGGPIGWQHGKFMLMSCFTDETGKCLLDSARCAWLQQCLEQEGPCEAPPITALLELPAGEVALNYLKEGMEADVNNSITTKDGNTPLRLSKIMEVTKMMADAAAQLEGGSSLMQQNQENKAQYALNRRRKIQKQWVKDQQDLLTTTTAPTFQHIAKVIELTIKITIYETLKRVKNDLLDTEEKRFFTYGILTLPVFYLAACGVTDQGAVMVNGKPVLAKFAPKGPDNKLKYLDVVKSYKFEKDIFTDEYFCSGLTSKFVRK